jgi:uncharacterized membrane protein
MPRRHHEVTRIEGFSDAVFAFSLTLLVVALEVPKDMAHLMELVRNSVPFGLMFAMVCWIWYEHNKFFRRYGLQDAWTATLNSLLLFVVLFYVYPLKFLTMLIVGPLIGASELPKAGTLDDARTLLILYSSGMVSIFGTFALLYRHARSKHEELALTQAEQIELKFEMRAHLLSMSLGVVSIAMVLIARPLVPYGGFIYFLMGPLHGWNGWMQGRAMRQFEAAGAGPAPPPAPPKKPHHAKR